MRRGGFQRTAQSHQGNNDFFYSHPKLRNSLKNCCIRESSLQKLPRCVNLCWFHSAEEALLTCDDFLSVCCRERSGDSRHAESALAPLVKVDEFHGTSNRPG